MGSEDGNGGDLPTASGVSGDIDGSEDGEVVHIVSSQLALDVVLGITVVCSLVPMSYSQVNLQ